MKLEATLHKTLGIAPASLRPAAHCRPETFIVEKVQFPRDLRQFAGPAQRRFRLTAV